MTGTELDNLIIRLTGDATSYLEMLTQAQSSTAKACADIEAQTDKLTESFTNQAATFGMTSREASLYKLQLAGATEEQLAAAKAAASHLDALEAESEATRQAGAALREQEECQEAVKTRGAQLTRSLETETERYNRQIEDLRRLLDAGAISQDTFNKGLTKLQQGLNSTQQGTQAVSKEVRSLEDALNSKAKSIAGAFAVIGVGATFWGAIGKFQDSEKLMLRLGASIESNGRVARIVTEDYKKFATQIAKTTLTGKVATLTMLQEAESMGLTDESAKRAIKNSIALAAAKGGEAQSYLRAAVGLEQGNTFMLRRMLHLHNMTDETKINAKVQQILASGMKIASEEAKGSAGSMQRLSVSMAGLTRDAGELLAGAIQPLINGLQGLADWFNNLDPLIRKIATTVVVLTAATAPVVTIFGAVKTGILFVATPLIGLIGYMTTAEGLMTGLAVTMGVLQVAAVAAGVAVTIYALNNLEHWLFSVESAYDEAVAKSKQLDAMAGVRRTVTTGNILKHAEEIDDPVAKQKYVGEQLGQATKELDSYKQMIKEAGDEVEKLDTYWNKLIRPKEIETAKRELETLKKGSTDLEQRLNSLKEVSDKLKPSDIWQKFRDEIDKTNKELIKHIATLGMTENQKKLYKLAGEGQKKIEELTAMQTGKSAEQLARYREELQANLDKELQYTSALMMGVTVFDSIQKVRNQLKEDVQSGTKSLTEETTTFGMSATAANLYKLALLGATQAQYEHRKTLLNLKDAQEEGKKLFEQGQQTIKEFETPLEKYNDRLRELQRLLAVNAITHGVYEKAVAKAREEVEKTYRAEENLQSAAFGSAAALKAYNEYQEKTSLHAKVPDVASGPVAGIVEPPKETVGVLKEILAVLKERTLKPETDADNTAALNNLVEVLKEKAKVPDLLLKLGEFAGI